MDKLYKIEVTTTADVEAKEAILWIKQHSPQAAKKFSDGLIEAIKSLRLNPLRCSIAPENDFFMKKLGNYFMEDIEF